MSNQARKEDGSVGITDLVLGRQLETRESNYADLVVELKRPNHTINDEDITQLRSYASAITNDERHNKPNCIMCWLIGNTTSNTVDEQRNQQNLLFGVVKMSQRYRLIVRTWQKFLEVQSTV